MSEFVQPIRVLIVDDHPVVRRGLRSLLAGQPDMEIVAEAENGDEVLPCLASQEADVILLDIRLKGQSGLDVARQVRRSHPAVKIIILTTYHDESYVLEALAAGVDGFQLKSVACEDLPDSIRSVMRGQKLLSPRLVGTVFSHYQELAREHAQREAGLKPIELKILAAIADGATNKDIAEQFSYSEALVKRSVQEILRKLGASNRAQAVAKVIRRGWL